LSCVYLVKIVVVKNSKIWVSELLDILKFTIMVRSDCLLFGFNSYSVIDFFGIVDNYLISDR